LSCLRARNEVGNDGQSPRSSSPPPTSPPRAVRLGAEHTFPPFQFGKLRASGEIVPGRAISRAKSGKSSGRDRRLSGRQRIFERSKNRGRVNREGDCPFFLGRLGPRSIGGIKGPRPRRTSFPLIQEEIKARPLSLSFFPRFRVFPPPLPAAHRKRSRRVLSR
jgi:hypothetical protein